MRMPSFFRFFLCSRWSFLFGILTMLLLVGIAFGVYRCQDDAPPFEIADQLGGNIFPSAILSTATTDTLLVPPTATHYVGNPKSPFAIVVHNQRADSRVRVELSATPFFQQSVSEFVLPKASTDYTIYPEVLWDYEKLRQNGQAQPINVVAAVTLGRQQLGTHHRTMSMRAVGECLLGYYRTWPSGKRGYRNTGILFAAYVNEDNPQIDEILREALNTRIVRRFQGYQTGTAASVDKQVYALWHVLQQRKFRYSSISNTSLSSNVIFSQRVRPFNDALRSSQINCVDGSVLFASLLRAINITPILVRTPGHMFVGYYSDNKRKDLTFIETTMIGDVDLDDYFPDEKLDSTMVGMSQKQASRMTFDKAKQYAANNYEKHKEKLQKGTPGYMFLEISKRVRSRIQPLGL